MKKGLRCLTGGLALIALLAWHVTPTEAQDSGSTSFTVQLQALAITVTPAAIDLGIVTAGASVFSPPTIDATNNSNVAVNFQIAGTNAQQVSPVLVNPSWLLNPLFAASDQFRWGFSAASPPLFTFLAGPGGLGFPALGTPLTLATGVSSTATVVTNWRFDSPTDSTTTGQQQFQIVVSIGP
ncbi:MAG: hypothetical protein ACE5JQ_03480 [Candidatus Methylomirabilales bacterium]